MVAALLIIVLKKQGNEFSFLITVCAVCVVALYIFLFAKDSFSNIKEIMNANGQNGEYITVAVKAIIIAYLAETVADTCRDFGQSALASKAELAGKCVIFVMLVPLFSSVCEIVIKYMNI